MNNGDFQHCDSAAQSSRFCSIEEMQMASELAGWDIRYTQIEPGRDTGARSISTECRDITLMDERIDRRIEVIGTAPAGYVTVLAPVGATRAWLNGQFVDSSKIILYRGGAETHLVTHNPAHVLSMHIPTDLLTASDFTNERQSAAHAAQQLKLLDPGPRASSYLRQAMYQSIHGRKTERQQRAQRVSLCDGIYVCEQEADTAPVGDRRCTTKSAVQTIGNARDYIHANLHEAMSIGEIAISAAASVSKLERVFRQQLGLTPSQYIRAHRLAAARSALQEKSNDRRQVARIALDCGFNHLGRFSRFYRSQFGETPSATLVTR